MEGMFSNKGAALWHGTWESVPFQVASVHLQGHVSGKRRQSKLSGVRRAQLCQLRDELLDPHRQPGVAQIVCGDFSIKRGTADYEPETLDYILLRQNGAPAITVTRTVRRYTQAWKARGGRTYRNLAYRKRGT